jgi:predicted NUDIX family phosphoesterase
VRGKLLRYRRSRTGGEKRLHDLYSIGVGGHISEQDSGEHNGYWAGMDRELQEEICMGAARAVVAAVVNDDRTEAGRVHFGVVHILPVRKEDHLKFCPDIGDPEYVSYREAVANLSIYEDWSRHCLEAGADLPANAIGQL